MVATGPISLGAKLRELREAQGLTQEAEAESLTRTARTIANWEADRCRPPRSVLLRLCDVLDVTIAELDAFLAGVELAEAAV